MNNDLISREWLRKWAKDVCDCFEEAAEVEGYVVLAMPEEAPAVDAVEVVRCKDCKHWGTGYGGETENVKVCEFANYMVGKNGYCVYGEKLHE